MFTLHRHRLEVCTRYISVKNSPQIQGSPHGVHEYIRCPCVFSRGKELSFEECYQPRLHHQHLTFSKNSRLGILLGLGAAPPERNAGHSLPQSRTAQGISLQTIVSRVAGERALVMIIFHPGSSLGW